MNNARFLANAHSFLLVEIYQCLFLSIRKKKNSSRNYLLLNSKQKILFTDGIRIKSTVRVLNRENSSFSMSRTYIFFVWEWFLNARCVPSMNFPILIIRLKSFKLSWICYFDCSIKRILISWFIVFVLERVKCMLILNVNIELQTRARFFKHDER